MILRIKATGERMMRVKVLYEKVRGEVAKQKGGDTKNEKVRGEVETLQKGGDTKRRVLPCRHISFKIPFTRQPGKTHPKMSMFFPLSLRLFEKGNGYLY